MYYVTYLCYFYCYYRRREKRGDRSTGLTTRCVCACVWRVRVLASGMQSARRIVPSYLCTRPFLHRLLTIYHQQQAPSRLHHPVSSAEPRRTYTRVHTFH